MRPFLAIGLGTLALAASCGGTAVIDGEPADGGGGSTSSSPNGGSGNVGNTGGSSTSSANGGTGNTGAAECSVNGDPTPPNCAGACDVLFCCAEPRCDGLAPSDEDQFRAGCEMSCSGMGMALVSVVNGERCEQTVNTVKSVSQQFAATCDGSGTGGGG